MDFGILEKELEAAIAADEKYERENSAKFRAVDQKVASYDEFRDIVKASHLTPLAKTEKVVDPDIAYKNVIWNSTATGKNEPVQNYPKTEKKKHFTENKLLDGMR